MTLKFSRVRAAPSAWTFKIKPIAELLTRYVPEGGTGWVDSFAGENSPAEWTNDWHPQRKAKYHLDAEIFCRQLCLEHITTENRTPFKGFLNDPPYSYRQISEHYKEFVDLKIPGAYKARSIDTSSNYYNRVMNAICDAIEPGGYAISFGWNSNGFGENRGFEPVEFMDVYHGQHHNDTLVIVEQKAGEE